MTPPSPARETAGGSLHQLLRGFIVIEPEEVGVLAWAWLYLFSVFFSYYILRPIRDEAGVAGGVNNLPWLFTGTLVGMMLVNTPFAALVARLPRVRFISLTYRFFALNLLLFLVLLRTTTGPANIWVGRIFFIWVSIFNLFVVSVFWSFMVDVFTSEQSKRMFGFIAAAATIGGILGDLLTATAVRAFGLSFLLLASALLLELAVFAVRRLSRVSQVMHTRQAEPARDDRTIGGGIFSGVTHVVSSPYLLNICAYITLYSILSTFLYFQQASIVDRSFSDRAARTAFFAWVDFGVNALTVGGQLFLTAAVLRRLGIAMTLTMVPALTVLGFVALGLRPLMWVAVAFIVLRRSGNFVFAQPSRQALFTVVPREDKYKAKNFIDTVAYRFGDQAGAWTSGGLTWLGYGVSGIAWTAVPLSVAWLINGWWLGRRQEARAHAAEHAAPVGELRRSVG